MENDAWGTTQGTRCREQDARCKTQGKRAQGEGLGTDIVSGKKITVIHI
jgi:hypothetical protein